MTQLLKVPEVAQRLQVSRWRCYEILRAGLIPTVRLGRSIRVNPVDLEMFVRSGGAVSADGNDE